MKRHAPVIALVLVLAALAVGLGTLLQLRLAQGDTFPPYSSLRSDPLGTRALYDSLGQLPALSVERGFDRLADLPAAPTHTLLLAGWSTGSWERVSRVQLDALEANVRNGGRLVFAFRAEAADDTEEIAHAEKKNAPTRKTKSKPESPRKTSDDSDKEDKEEQEPAEKIAWVDLHRRWGVEVKDKLMADRDAKAEPTDEPRASGLPAHVPWRSEIFFNVDPGAGWRVIYKRAHRPVLVERSLGLGTIVLASDSYFLSNEALEQDRLPSLLAWLVGNHTQVVFDETHLGVARDPGIAELARRYGLAGGFFTLLLLAALFVWRRMATFVPPVDESPDVSLAYHPAAGLESLVRRSVPPQHLATACLDEWKATARASDRARVEAAWAALPAHTPAAARYNAAVHALRRH